MQTSQTKTLPMSMTWKAFADIVVQLARSGNHDAVVEMWADLRRMASLADAFAAIEPTLTDEQREIASTAIPRQ